MVPDPGFIVLPIRQKSLFCFSKHAFKSRSPVVVPSQYCNFYEIALGQVMEPVLPTLKRKSLIFLGTAGVGKTPAMQVLLMALSRYWMHRMEVTDQEPYFKTAEDLDFYRDDPGQVWCGCALDDGDCNLQLVRVMKSFLDITLREALTRERWGAAKFVQNQPRMICDNKWDETAEPKMVVNGERRPWKVGFPGTDNKQFMEMIRPAMPEKATLSDIEAVCKRATIIVNSYDFVYVRPAGLSADVTIVRYKKEGMYITEGAKKALERYTDHKEKRDQKTLDHLIEEEQDHFRKVMAGEGEPNKKVKIEITAETFHERVEKLAEEFDGRAIDCDRVEEAVSASASSSSPAAATNPMMEQSPDARRALFKKRTKDLADSMRGRSMEVHDQPQVHAFDDADDVFFRNEGEL
jgi:hypothetical protein